jgi:hypothetical protein
MAMTMTTDAERHYGSSPAFGTRRRRSTSPASADAAYWQGQGMSGLSASSAGYTGVSTAGQGMYGSGMGVYNTGVSGMTGMVRVPVQAMVDQAGTTARAVNEAQVGSWRRGMTRMGINPASGRYAGTLSEQHMRGAANIAGAMNRTRLMGEREQFGRYHALAGAGAGMAGHGVSAMATGADGAFRVAHAYGDAAADAGQYAYEIEEGDNYAAEADLELAEFEALLPKKTQVR